MGYRFRFADNGLVLILRFEGVITPEEEVQAVHDVLADPRMKPDARILVDRTGSRMTVNPEHVQPHIELIRENQSRFGIPKIAVVVSTDYDFGMMRMLELRADDKILHDFMVFRTVEEACDWLGLDPTETDWP